MNRSAPCNRNTFRQKASFFSHAHGLVTLLYMFHHHMIECVPPFSEGDIIVRLHRLNGFLPSERDRIKDCQAFSNIPLNIKPVHNKCDNFVHVRIGKLAASSPPIICVCKMPLIKVSIRQKIIEIRPIVHSLFQSQPRIQGENVHINIRGKPKRDLMVAMTFSWRRGALSSPCVRVCTLSVCVTYNV